MAVIAATMLLMPSALAEDLKKAQRDLEKVRQVVNNFSHENQICSAYYYFVRQCLLNRDPTDPLAETYKAGGDTFLKRSIDTGKIIGISQKALSARMDIAIANLKSETESDCVNVSVLLKKHAQQCKLLFEDGPGSFADAMGRLGIK
jgi:hypothetical protein